MKDQILDTNHAAEVPVRKGTIKFIWLKAFTIPIMILVIIGSFAIVSGRNKARPIDWIYVNAVTEKKKVELPDGSKVVLRKGSTLAYPANYAQTQRYVRITGEAFFQVTYNASLPFYVKAKNEITADAGSSFLIRSNDSIEIIVVTAGQVRLERNNDKGDILTLKAGQKLELMGSKLRVSLIGKANYFAWANEQLIFNQASLRQVADDIFNLYGVPIYFSSEINPDEITITAQFNNLPLKDILESIAAKSALLIKYTGESVLISLPDKRIFINSENDSINKKRKGSWLKRIFSNKK